jgi:hypothetical protein
MIRYAITCTLTYKRFPQYKWQYHHWETKVTILIVACLFVLSNEYRCLFLFELELLIGPIIPITKIEYFCVRCSGELPIIINDRTQALLVWNSPYAKMPTFVHF